jgi:hypothetical protein
MFKIISHVSPVFMINKPNKDFISVKKKKTKNMKIKMAMFWPLSLLLTLIIFTCLGN